MDGEDQFERERILVMPAVCPDADGVPGRTVRSGRSRGTGIGAWRHGGVGGDSDGGRRAVGEAADRLPGRDGTAGPLLAL